MIQRGLPLRSNLEVRCPKASTKTSHQAQLGTWPCLTMAATFAVIIAMVMGLEWGTSVPTIALYLTIFALAWIAQLIGHKVEGGSPSFLEDLQFLLIGPLWVFYH